MNLLLHSPSRPSLFSSSQHQPFSTIVNPELPLQSSHAFQVPSTSVQLVPSHGFLPSNGVPWRCPEWMTSPNVQSGVFMNFNGQPQTRMPFKRKASPDMDS